MKKMFQNLHVSVAGKLRFFNAAKLVWMIVMVMTFNFVLAPLMGTYTVMVAEEVSAKSNLPLCRAAEGKSSLYRMK